MPRKPKQKIKPVKARPTTILNYYRALRNLVATLSKQIDRDLGPILYNLSASETAPVATVTDAEPTLGLEITAAFNSLWDEWRRLENMAGPLARKSLTSATVQHRRDFITSFKQGAGIDVGKITDPAARVGSRPVIEKELFSRGRLIDAVCMNSTAWMSSVPQYLQEEA